MFLFLFLAVNVNVFRFCLLFSACRQEVLRVKERGGVSGQLHSDLSLFAFIFQSMRRGSIIIRRSSSSSSRGRFAICALCFYYCLLRFHFVPYLNRRKQAHTHTHAEREGEHTHTHVSVCVCV